MIYLQDKSCEILFVLVSGYPSDVKGRLVQMSLCVKSVPSMVAFYFSRGNISFCPGGLCTA